MKALACVAAALAAFLSCAPAKAETTLCTEITALPFTITAQGVYCLKQNLNVNIASGNAITINAGNVVIDFNDFRVNNLAAVTNTASGVFAENRKNVTLRNGFIRGFHRGVYLLEATANASGGHLVTSMKIADCGHVGIHVQGDGSVVRENRVRNIGGGTSTSASGILLRDADDGLIAGNIVSDVSETAETHGVYVSISNRVQVTDNDISNVDGSASDQGIGLFAVNRAIIAGNVLLNEAVAGTGGIVDGVNNSASIACFDNEIGGFTAAPLAGCNTVDGNRVAFN